METLFIDINNDGILEASLRKPWDNMNISPNFYGFYYQGKPPLKFVKNKNLSGWWFSEVSKAGWFDFDFTLSQIYEIKNDEKTRYYIIDNFYLNRRVAAENIEEYLFQHYQDDESPPKGYQGSPGYIPPSREELVKEFSEADVLLWEKAGKQKIPRDPKENITAKYLEKNWEKHTLTELYMNDRKNQVKGRLVKTVEDFKALLKDGEWQQADVTVEKYQWAYAKEIAVIGEYYDKAKQQPVMLNVGVKDELVKVLEFGPHRETKIFTKEGKVPLKKYKEGHLK